MHPHPFSAVVKNASAQASRYSSRERSDFATALHGVAKHTTELTVCCGEWNNGKQKPPGIIKKASNDR